MLSGLLLCGRYSDGIGVLGNRLGFAVFDFASGVEYSSSLLVIVAVFASSRILIAAHQTFGTVLGILGHFTLSSFAFLHVVLIIYWLSQPSLFHVLLQRLDVKAHITSTSPRRVVTKGSVLGSISHFQLVHVEQFSPDIIWVHDVILIGQCKLEWIRQSLMLKQS